MGAAIRVVLNHVYCVVVMLNSSLMDMMLILLAYLMTWAVVEV